MDPSVNDAKSDFVLCCPICREQLQHQGRTFACGNGHQFDIAKEGYVNLLRLKKRPKFLGDSKEMLQARRSFLDADYYAPLASRLAEMAQTHYLVRQAESAHPYRILDAGCGEGYYLRQAAKGFTDSSQVQFLGMDIAKDGPRMAAKQLPQSLFFVADINQQLLLPDKSVDALLNIFAPRNLAEFARVLRPTGQLIVVIPTANHLVELREMFELLAIQADKANLLIEQMAAAGLALSASEYLSTQLALNQSALRHLLHMTPNQRHLTNEQQYAAVEQSIQAVAEPTQVTAHFQVLTFMLTAEK